MPEAGPFTKLSETVGYEGTVIRAGVATFAAPDGRTFRRDFVRHPGAVVIVPVDADRNVVLVRQYRLAIGRQILEVPAGKRDVDGESPEETAHRELAEEIGRRAGSLERLAEFYNSPGFADEYTYLFLARDLTVVPEDHQGEEEQHMEVVTVGLDRALAMIGTGDIVDAKTIIGLVLADRRLS